MSDKAGYYTDRDGDIWLRLGKLAVVYHSNRDPVGGRPDAVWTWALAKEKWGPMINDQRMSVD